MRKKNTFMKYLLLVFAGTVVGALVFSNVEFNVALNGSSFSNSPRFASAKNSIESYPIQSLQSFNEAFVQIAESATPSVVTIFTEKTVNQQMVSPFSFFGTPFDDFFGMPKRGLPNGRKEVQRGLGSGVIVTDDGYILTNNHVIDGADVVYIRTFDNRKIAAKVIGKDPKTDLAVIKVNAKGFKPILIGDSDKLRVGEWVIAIGSPLGENLARTVTQGIVSAKGRANVGLADYEDFIQTDAAINPGNSGGALVNINGDLVGINTAIASRTGGFEGIGFAVPSNMAKAVLISLINSGKVTRGYLGITIQDIDENLAKAMNLKMGEGVLVGTVVDGSPAAKSGVRTGDVILDFNTIKVKSSVELRNAIARETPGTIVKMRVQREGSVRLVSLRLEAQPSKEVASATPAEREKVTAALGFNAEELTAALAERLNLKQGAGRVIITAIDPSSNAYTSGLRSGDIILSVNRQSVSSFSQYSAIVKNIKAGNMLFLLVERGGNRIYFAFNV
ncbi:DegQ family serine endoprotease [Chlorobium sp. BLA1]|uniref:DegQ family serine endoprotease n=1 Tax=Candidatus Chlorobium masyuteum TaxID=2716876 RepID=UPI0014213D1E|nr:DegQ family serine endoprotease [Candidatus Chlorobium masyuteum]NHQ61179.1 DegQ family serine endoprotease [Candidatus Chlorobium masyuteum]NTU44420.1 DegQ family serine endoprotease [Chlorobiaceae bacterium]